MINLGLFALLSVIWGLTWAAVKIGLGDVQPIFLAAVRYVVVAIMLVASVKGITSVLTGERWRRVLASAILVNCATYILLYWGMQFVPSGLSGVINLSIIPVALFVFAVVRGEEEWSVEHVAALVVGLGGLAALFAPRIAVQAGGDFAGVAAIVLGTLAFCAGSIASKPLLKEASPLAVTGAQAVVAAVVLPPVSYALEPIDASTWLALTQPPALASVAFLVFAGTIAGYAIYLRLIDDWGAPRAGLYGLVSPVVALIFGFALFDERIGMLEIFGAMLLLAGSALALHAGVRSANQATA